MGIYHEHPDFWPPDLYSGNVAEALGELMFGFFRMLRAAYLHSLWPLLLAAVALEFGLYLLLGQRWFSFYGHATTALVIVLPLAWIVTSRYRRLGLRRWPAWIFFTLIAIAALAQIAYWAVFFANRELAIMLAVGRGMFLEYAGALLPWLAVLAALLVLWLTARGVRAD